MNATRERIVGATTELFRRRGYNGTSLKQVTDSAQATTGSLYHFFPGGKHELTSEVLTESGEAYRQLLEMIVDEAPDMANAITELFEGAATVLEETGFIDPCPIGTVAREVASVDDRLREVTDTVFRSWITTAAGRLQDAGIDQAEAEALATTLVAAIEGGFILSRSARNGDALRSAGRHMRALVESALDHSPAPRR